MLTTTPGPPRSSMWGTTAAHPLTAPSRSSWMSRVCVSSGISSNGPHRLGAGDVRPDVDPAETPEGGGGQLLDLAGRGQVRGDGQHRRCPEHAALARRLVQPVVTAGGDDHR